MLWLRAQGPRLNVSDIVAAWGYSQTKSGILARNSDSMARAMPSSCQFPQPSPIAPQGRGAAVGPDQFSDELRYPPYAHRNGRKRRLEQPKHQVTALRR
jgi:hypothetical protein